MAELEKTVLVRKLYASAFDPERLEEFLAADCVYHGPGETLEGIEALRERSRELHDAFPDLRFSVDALRVEEDQVEVRWTLHATHERPIEGDEATGRSVEMSGRTVEVIRDGRIVERFGEGVPVEDA